MAGERPTQLLAPVRSRRPHASPRAGACPGKTSSPHFVELVDAGIHEPRNHAVLRPVDRRRAGSSGPGRPRSGCGGTERTGRPTSGRSPARRLVDGEPIGMQDLAAEHFRAVRSVESGSWLGRAHQGRGLGREMREAMLHLAFEGLGARGGAERRLRGQRRVAGHVAGDRLRGERRGPGDRGATVRAAPSASGSVATPGSTGGATTSRSSGSRAVSTCSSGRPVEPAPPGRARPGSELALQALTTASKCSTTGNGS